MSDAVATKKKSAAIDSKLRLNTGNSQIPWISVSVLLIVGLLFWLHRAQSQLPDRVTIAGGPKNGRYAMIAQGIADELRRRHSIDVDVLETTGSLANLQLLESHSADLAMYQPGTKQVLEGEDNPDSSAEPALYVANLYPEVLLPIAPAMSQRIQVSNDSHQKWGCNNPTSGDFAATKLLLQHMRLEEKSVDVKTVSYVELPGHLRAGSVDVGIVCCGLRAPILRASLAVETGRLLKIPAVEAMAEKHAALKLEKIPAGFFSTSPMVPSEDYHTVSTQAQLLADSGAPVSLVEEVTRIVMDARFQRRMELTRLSSGGVEYATDRPEYSIHPGAAHVYHPGLKPLLNPDFVEGTEGLRSFVVSLLAALWLLHRWWTRRQIRSQEHRLDRYIKELLELENAQMDVDGEGGAEESQSLQGMLDRVTVLRQEALAEFTAHELNEDRAIDCFIEMCHALSDKINGKLTRHAIHMLASAKQQ